MKSNKRDQLVLDAMQENIELAELAINTPRKEGSDSCYGNSAVILLSSVLDAIGAFYCHKDNDGSFTSYDQKPNRTDRGFVKEHFKKVYNLFIKDLKNNCGYSDDQSFVNDFYENFRCELTHNAVFEKGCLVLHEDSDNSIKRLNVKELLSMVKEVYDAFIKQNSLVVENNSDESVTAHTASNKSSNQLEQNNI